MLLLALAVATAAGRIAPSALAADPVLIAAGDIASCSSTGARATAALLDALPGTIVTLGDNAYQSGTAAEFASCYDPTWGRRRADTRPAPGNHDYVTPGASAYYAYFGSAAGDPARGYYSYDLGTWHIVAINSNCSAIGGCGAIEVVPHVRKARAEIDLVRSMQEAHVIIGLIHRGSAGSRRGADVKPGTRDIESHSSIPATQLITVHLYPNVAV